MSEDISAELAKLDAAEIDAADTGGIVEEEATIVEDTQEAVEESNDSEDAPQYSEVEQRAIDKGWNPNGKRDAETFLEFGEVIDKLNATAKENAKQRETIKLMLDKFQTKEKRAYEKALKDLQQQRADAVADGDVQKFSEIEKQLQEVNDEIKSFSDPAKEREDSLKQAADDFANRNKAWYNLDTTENYIMRQEAISEDERLATLYPNMEISERLRLVEKAIRDRHPNHVAFVNPRRETAVAAVTSTEKRRDAKPLTKLTKGQEESYQVIRRVDKTYTREQYLQDLADME